MPLFPVFGRSPDFKLEVHWQLIRDPNSSRIAEDNLVPVIWNHFAWACIGDRRASKLCEICESEYLAQDVVGLLFEALSAAEVVVVNADNGCSHSTILKLFSGLCFIAVSVLGRARRNLSRTNAHPIGSQTLAKLASSNLACADDTAIRAVFRRHQSFHTPHENNAHADAD